MWSFFKNRLFLALVFLALLAMYWQNKYLNNYYNSYIGDYVISNENEFKKFAKQVNKGNSFEGKTVVLAKNIALTENWTPIGDSANRFQGIFDGSGYNISGLNVENVELAGLFGYVGKHGQIKNVRVIAKKIKGTISAGGLAGIYNSSKPIENSRVKADSIIASNDLKNSYSGGLVGTFIIHEYNAKFINAKRADTSAADALIIINSYASGNVLAFNHDMGSYSGGLVGLSANTILVITNSCAIGSVSAQNSMKQKNFQTSAGGLVGHVSKINIFNSFANNNVYAQGHTSYSGGLVGLALNMKIFNSYSIGNVMTLGNVNFSGGLVGKSFVFNISNSYYIGNLLGNYIDDIFGKINDYGKINSVYYNLKGASKATDKSSPNGILGLFPEDFKKQESFKDWDFQNIWKMDNKINYGYPYLRWSEKIVQNIKKTKLVGSGSGGISELDMDYKIIRDLASESIYSTRSKEDIMQVVNDRMYELRKIYNDYLELKPGFSGKVTLEFTIVPSGDIIKIDILSSTTGYPNFDNAIKDMVATWKWKPIYKGNVTPTMPFNFTE